MFLITHCRKICAHNMDKSGTSMKYDLIKVPLLALGLLFYSVFQCANGADTYFDGIADVKVFRWCKTYADAGRCACRNDVTRLERRSW